jgi:hypothetical protein
MDDSDVFEEDQAIQESIAKAVNNVYADLVELNLSVGFRIEVRVITNFAEPKDQARNEYEIIKNG